MKQNELFELKENTSAKLPVMGVPITIVEYLCNKPPKQIDGIKIVYVRADGEPAKNVVFYLDSKDSSEINFFEVLDMKCDCKINGKTLYRRVLLRRYLLWLKYNDREVKQKCIAKKLRKKIGQVDRHITKRKQTTSLTKLDCKTESIAFCFGL